MKKEFLIRGPSLISQNFTIPVNYCVHFTRKVFAPSNTCLQKIICHKSQVTPPKVFVILDGGLVKAQNNLHREINKYFELRKRKISLVNPILTIPGGEKAKSSEYWYRLVQKQLHRCHVDRHAFVLTIGGGALLDMGGFAAAITHRGVRNIRLPTTVLSQADGGLGVKTGVNCFGVKNFIGTFTPPYAVVNDSSFLLSLPTRHLTSGMAEAVKAALIRKKNFFEWLEKNASRLRSFEMPKLNELIGKCAKIHLEHIALSGDPFESGSARPLDFGHWAAHKLESLTSYKLHHGEAVAIGIAVDSRYSFEIGLLNAHAFDRILQLLDQLGLPSWHPALEFKEQNGQLKVLKGLEEFKEHIGGELTVTLLKEIGEGTEVDRIDRTLLKRALNWLGKRHRSRCA